MGLFGGRAKDGHRRLLAEASQLVKQYRIPDTQSFDLSSLPVELRGAVAMYLDTVLWHIENTPEGALGDGDTMRELNENYGLAHLLCTGRYGRDTHRNFRTSYFEAAVDRLAQVISRAAAPDGRPKLTLATVKDALKEASEAVETSLSWFSSPPEPRSSKYSQAQANMMLAEGKRELERRQSKAAASARGERTCMHCKQPNDADARFCKSCGKPLGTPKCPACAVANDADAAFCKGCGTRLKDPRFD